MSTERARVFEDAPAVRGPTPLLFGLIGPSGSGKTFSALRLATGIQRVVGGDIFVIDTEANRALHYAELFKFRHVPFAAPFAPDDYQAAIEHCVSKGAKTIIIDSMSHEHEGQGGVLEWHAQEVERIMAAWKCGEGAANIPAWSKPKAARRRLINFLLQVRCNFILCFRAKDKIKIGKDNKGKSEVTQLGFMPIAGEEFVYELTAKSLLLPGANGVPTWQSDQIGERLMIKLPEQFRGIFSGADGKPLDEDIGTKMAQWAAGTPAPKPPTVEEYDSCADQSAFDVLEKRRADTWKTIPPSDAKNALKKAADAAKARLATAATTKTTEPEQQPLTPETAIAALRACPDELSRLNTWAEISEHFCGEVPLDVEAANHEMKEKFDL